MDWKSFASIIEMVFGGRSLLELVSPVGLVVVVLAIYCIHILLNGDHQKGLLGYFQARNKSKLEQLERYLSNSTLADPDCVREIREIYDAEVFESYTGIYAEKAKRTELIWLHKRIGKHPSWKIIKIIHESIEFDDSGKIFIKQYSRIQRYCLESLKLIALGVFVIGQALWMLVVNFSSNKIEGIVIGVFIYVATILLCVRIANAYARQYLVMHAADELKDQSSEVDTADQVPISGEESEDRSATRLIDIRDSASEIATEELGMSSDIPIVR